VSAYNCSHHGGLQPAGSNEPLFAYTLMPTYMREMYSVEELGPLELGGPFSFTKGLKTMKIPATGRIKAHGFGTMLFDLADDPRQERPIDNSEVEEMMIAHLVREMKANDAPSEQFERLGLADRV